MIIMDLLQTIFSAIAIIVALIIPEKIKWNQMYSNLISEYRSYDFAIAVQRIIEFFVIECESDVSKIPEKYRETFLNEIYGISNASIKSIDDIKKNYASDKGFQKDSDKTLHFQRRLLTQFYWDLDVCLKSIYVGKKRVLKDFTKGEANIIRILYFMNEAVDNDELLYKDLNCFEHVPSKSKGIKNSLCNLYKVLKKSNRFIEE